jgi:glycosyltransferase involved in cell wall biosynthesis
VNIVIASGIFPPDIGGPATYVPWMASALAARGHRVTVVTMGDGPSDGGSGPFELVRVPRRGPRAARWSGSIAALVRAGRFADVLLAAGLLPQAAAASARWRRPLVTRLVSDLVWDRATAFGWTSDDLETFQRRRYGVRVEAMRLLQRWAVLRAARVIVPSRWLAEWVARLDVPPGIVRIIPNALPPLPPVVPQRIPVRTTHLVATVGRLVSVKQIDLAIRALAGVPDTSLLVIGDGPQRRSLHDLADDAGVGERVIFAGARPREEALALLAGCDALVQSSAHEGFPYTLLEAMHLGIPVIATAVGGVPEIVSDGDNGLLVDGTPTALAAGLLRLLQLPDLRRRLAAKARQDVARRFGTEDTVVATEQVLGEALASRS